MTGSSHASRWPKEVHVSAGKLGIRFSDDPCYCLDHAEKKLNSFKERRNKKYPRTLTMVERREERTVDIFSVKTTARLRRGGETR